MRPAASARSASHPTDAGNGENGVDNRHADKEQTRRHGITRLPIQGNAEHADVQDGQSNQPRSINQWPDRRLPGSDPRGVTATGAVISGGIQRGRASRTDDFGDQWRLSREGIFLRGVGGVRGTAVVSRIVKNDLWTWWWFDDHGMDCGEARNRSCIYLWSSHGHAAIAFLRRFPGKPLISVGKCSVCRNSYPFGVGGEMSGAPSVLPIEAAALTAIRVFPRISECAALVWALPPRDFDSSCQQLDQKSSDPRRLRNTKAPSLDHTAICWRETRRCFRVDGAQK